MPVRLPSTRVVVPIAVSLGAAVVAGVIAGVLILRDEKAPASGDLIAYG